jgi:hypothetical protein
MTSARLSRGVSPAANQPKRYTVALRQTGLSVRRGVAAHDLPVFDEHRTDRGNTVSATLARSTGASGNESNDEHNRKHNRQCDHRQCGSSIVLYVPQDRPRAYNERQLNLVTPRGRPSCKKERTRIEIRRLCQRPYA